MSECDKGLLIRAGYSISLIVERAQRVSVQYRIV